MNKVKAAIYIRVSTIDQAIDGFSLEAQTKKANAYCEYKDYSIYEIYTDTSSGKNTVNRPAFNKMIADMKARKFSKIIAYKIDRISRNTVDFLTFLELINKYDCDIDFLEGDVDVSGPTGKMVATVLSSVAELERNMIVERTLMGMEEAANNGHFGGKPPLGYTKEIINGEKGKKWVIDEKEAKIVSEIFELCSKGKTFYQISLVMKEKYPDIISGYKIDKETDNKVPVYRAWTDSSICKIVNNRIYLGVMEFRKTLKGKRIKEIEGQIPAIISTELFEQCQENIDRNKRNYYRSKQYLFTQKLKCPKCGRIMACKGTKKKNGQEYLYYKCKDCKTYFREDMIEKVVKDRLATLLELYLVLEKNYITIDNETLKQLQHGNLDNSVRFAMDSIRIKKYMTKTTNINYINQIWDNTDYETKCNMVYEYIDSIEVKQHRKGKKISVELVNVSIKSYKFKQFLEMWENNIIDNAYVGYAGNEYSITEFTKKQADEYIALLQAKYNIKVIDTFKENKYVYNENVFKMISVDSNRAVEEDTILYLELIT